MASAVLIDGSQPQRQRLGRAHDRHRARGEATDRTFHLRVFSLRSMVEERDPTCSRSVAQAHGVLGWSRAEGSFGLDLFSSQVSVVDQEIDVLRQLQSGLVVLTQTVRTG